MQTRLSPSRIEELAARIATRIVTGRSMDCEEETILFNSVDRRDYRAAEDLAYKMIIEDAEPAAPQIYHRVVETSRRERARTSALILACILVCALLIITGRCS